MRAAPTLRAAMLVLAVAAVADAAETARQMLDRRKTLDDTTRKWTDRQERLAMTIRDGRGGERQRTLKLYERRLPGDARQTIVFFESPAEVRAAGFLPTPRPAKPPSRCSNFPRPTRCARSRPPT